MLNKARFNIAATMSLVPYYSTDCFVKYDCLAL